MRTTTQKTKNSNQQTNGLRHKAANNNGWTPERRARQAEKIKAWRPWERSTGPRTAGGKAICARNAVTHGMRCRTVRYLRKLMKIQCSFRRACDALAKGDARPMQVYQVYFNSLKANGFFATVPAAPIISRE